MTDTLEPKKSWQIKPIKTVVCNDFISVASVITEQFKNLGDDACNCGNGTRKEFIEKISAITEGESPIVRFLVFTGGAIESIGESKNPIPVNIRNFLTSAYYGGISILQHSGVSSTEMEDHDERREEVLKMLEDQIDNPCSVELLFAFVDLTKGVCAELHDEYSQPQTAH